MPTCHIALGSNIDAEVNLTSAASLLRDSYPSIRFSSVYQSPSLLKDDQDDYLNAVAVLETGHSPDELLTVLQTIEKKLQKNVAFEWGPRTIDLALLLYGNHVHPSEKTWKEHSQKPKAKSQLLIVPHPRMHERAFVLRPLCELLDPQQKHPILEIPWNEWMKRTENEVCERIDFEL